MGENMFTGNKGLKSIVLGSADNPFEVGTEFKTNYGDMYFSSHTDHATYGKKGLIYLGSLFSNCSSLESVDFQYYRVNPRHEPAV